MITWLPAQGWRVALPCKAAVPSVSPGSMTRSLVAIGPIQKYLPLQFLCLLNEIELALSFKYSIVYLRRVCLYPVGQSLRCSDLPGHHFECSRIPDHCSHLPWTLTRETDNHLETFLSSSWPGGQRRGWVSTWWRGGPRIRLAPLSVTASASASVKLSVSA